MIEVFCFFSIRWIA